jgi:hypothetical protein
MCQEPTWAIPSSTEAVLLFRLPQPPKHFEKPGYKNLDQIWIIHPPFAFLHCFMEPDDLPMMMFGWCMHFTFPRHGMRQPQSQDRGHEEGT